MPTARVLRAWLAALVLGTSLLACSLVDVAQILEPTATLPPPAATRLPVNTSVPGNKSYTVPAFNASITVPPSFLYFH